MDQGEEHVPAVEADAAEHATRPQIAEAGELIEDEREIAVADRHRVAQVNGAVTRLRLAFLCVLRVSVMIPSPLPPLGLYSPLPLK